MKLLHLDSSILGDNSASRELSAAIVARWQDAVPALTVTYRDLSSAPLPHLSGGSLAGADPTEAAEAQRVGRAYWIQTPNRRFPLETHLLTPFVHLLPRKMQAIAVGRLTVWSLLNRGRAAEKQWYLDHFLNDVRLLSAGEFASLFPAATIRQERFLLLTKSLIATRGTLEQTWDGNHRGR